MTKPAYIIEAERWVGTREIKGKRNNPDIVKFYEDAVGETHPDEVSWCAAFVGACLKRTGYKGSESLAARSYANVGTKLDGPELYSIGVMKWTNSSWKGHVGFVVDFDENYVWLLGGNQSDQVKISRYPRHGGTLQFFAFVRPSKRYGRNELSSKSRKLKTTDAIQGVSTVGAAGGLISWQTLGTVRDFMTDNAGLILLGVAGAVIGLTYLYQHWIVQDYKSDRYTPSGE